MLKEIWAQIQEELKQHGVEIDLNGHVDVDAASGGKGKRVKVVVVSPDLQESVDEIKKAPRDQVVMVRVDEATSKALDDWVTTGAVKSRSEAAALFIREGLKVREAQLDQLKDALRDVEDAQARLRQKAKEVFGG